MKRSLISGFEKLKEKVHAIRGSVFAGFCARNKTAAIALAVAAVFLTAAAYRSSLAPGDAYILSDGRLSAVDLSSGEAVQVTVRGTKDGTVRTKEVILRHKDGDEKAVEDVVSDDEEIDFEISRVVRSINNSGARIAYLPETAEDGTALDWSAKKSSPKYLFPIPPAAAALYYMYRGEASKEKEREKKNAEAIVVLPLVILILVSFVGITAHFYKCLRAQNELQQQAFEEIDSSDAILKTEKYSSTISSLPGGICEEIFTEELAARFYIFDEAAIVRTGDKASAYFRRGNEEKN